MESPASDDDLTPASAESSTPPTTAALPDADTAAAADTSQTVDIRKTVQFRTVRPTDIPSCAAMEKASYPEDEAASKSTLQYRQHHAARYFRCAVLPSTDGQDELQADKDDNDTVIGFICSTRCREFEHESMSTHVPDGRLLAIHSVVVGEEYRHKGIATAMLKDYVKEIRNMSYGKVAPIEKIVLLAKKELLTFYIHCGFQVVRPSPIVHGRELWYELSADVNRLADRPGIPCFVVDAFSDPDQAGTGNPAAVVVLKEADLESESLMRWMQIVAAEFNLSETAFVVPRVGNEAGDDNGESEDENELHYSIRYFTPTVEVPLCGHATLASAAILFQTAQAKNRTETTVVFHAKEDILRAESASTSSRQSLITMRFPSKPPRLLESDEAADSGKKMLQSALNVEPTDVLYVGLSEIGDLLVELTFESFAGIGYDGLNYDAFLEWEGFGRGVIVCCVSPPGAPDEEVESQDTVATDFLSRFFGPKAGINEDPVTGSAHCVLAPYFCEKLGKDHVTGMQMSRRGGRVECKLEKDTVRLTGSAVTAMSGTLWL